MESITSRVHQSGSIGDGLFPVCRAAHEIITRIYLRLRLPVGGEPKMEKIQTGRPDSNK